MDYELARAIAILKAAHAEMKRASGRAHPALGDLEASGVKTGAVAVKRKPRRRRRAA